MSAPAPFTPPPHPSTSRSARKVILSIVGIAVLLGAASVIAAAVAVSQMQFG